MAIKPLDQRLASMMQESRADVPTEPIDLPAPIDPGEQRIQTEEAELVAGIGTRLSEILGGRLLKGVTEKGAKAAREPAIIPDAPPAAPTQAAPTPAAQQPAPPTKAAPQPKKVEGAGAPAIPVEDPPVASPPKVAPAPVDAAKMLEMEKSRKELLENQATLGAPSPTAAQEAAGVTKTPISTMAFDDESMRATIRAASEAALKDEPSMSLRSIYMKAINAGLTESQADRILQGLPMESAVGGSELAKNLAGLVHLHDNSARQLDDLFQLMTDGKLDDVGKLQLRQQMAFHDSVVKSLKGVQVDIARSMNVFKRVKDSGPALKQADIRKILDEVGGDDALLRLASDYLNVPTRAGKNRLLEAGLGKRLSNAWMYTYQAHLLTNPESHGYNLVSNVLFGALAPVERSVAVAIGAARQSMNIGSSERYYMGDILARISGIQNGLMDGWELAAHVARTGQRATAKGDQPLEPLRAEYFSDVPVKTGNVLGTGLDIASMTATTMATGLPVPVSPMLGGLMDFGKEVARIPDITNSWVGRSVDKIGFLTGLPFRALAMADEFTGGVNARMQLHEEAWNFANKEYDRLIAAGMTPEDATKETVRMTTALLNERPATIAANVESFRKQSTLMEELDRTTKLGSFYWKLDHAFQQPGLKVFMPFAKTITNIFIEGAARTPVANFVSPRFWDEWNKGGKHRDLAMARLAVGGTAAYTFANLSMENKVTGPGPESPEDKAALTAIGWQPYSRIFQKDEFEPGPLGRLSTLTKVTPGSGPAEGLLFVSFARFEPVSLPFAVGAGIGEYLKFHKGRPDESDVLKLVLAGSAAAGDYITNLPAAQGIGDLVSIMRGRQEDGGRKVVDVFERLSRQYADYLYTGTPIVGFSNSSIIAKMERIIDPELRSTMPADQDVPHGLRAFAEQRSRLFSRLPGISAGVPEERDNVGRIRKVVNRGLDNWWNFIPTISVTEGKRGPMDEALVSIDYGISRPNNRWSGVGLSGEQYNRYKELYGQIVKIPGSADGVPRNLEQAIPVELEALRMDALISGQTFLKGDAQKAVDALVSKYRRVAKIRMIGFDDSPQMGQSMAPDLSEFGLFSPKIEYPELAAAVKRNKDFERIEGR